MRMLLSCKLYIACIMNQVVSVDPCHQCHPCSVREAAGSCPQAWYCAGKTAMEFHHEGVCVAEICLDRDTDENELEK